MDRVKKYLKSADKHTLALFVIALVIVFLMSILSNRFLKADNINSMALQFPEYGILSLGMMLCMISGGIDLSLVGAANLSGIVAAVVILGLGKTPLAIPLGIAAALAVGALCGLLNGFLIGQLSIPAMVVTLCGQQLYTGLGMAITKGPAITGLPASLQIIGNGSIANLIPYSAAIFVLLAVLAGYLLKNTIYGRQLCFMGFNPTASRYAGINNLSVTLRTYMLSGIMAAIAGIIIISHYASAKSDYGSSYTLLTLLIVVLGGVNPVGGSGKVLGVTLAVIVLQLISSAFNLLGFNSFFKTLVFGFLLLAVMVVKFLLQSRGVKAPKPLQKPETGNNVPGGAQPLSR